MNSLTCESGAGFLKKEVYIMETRDKITFKAEDDWGYYNEKGKYFKGTFTKCGYNQFRLPCADGKFHSLLAHRLKWEFFNGKIPEGMVIDHVIPISEGGTDRLSNLRLTTQEGNVNNPISKEKRIKALRSDSYKEKKHKSQTNGAQSKQVYQYTLDGKLVKIWASTNECGRNGYIQSSVCLCCNGKQSSHKGFKWAYF